MNAEASRTTPTGESVNHCSFNKLIIKIIIINFIIIIIIILITMASELSLVKNTVYGKNSQCETEEYEAAELGSKHHRATRWRYMAALLFSPAGKRQNAL